MNSKQRLQSLSELGVFMLEEMLDNVVLIESARVANPWFTSQSIKKAIKAIATRFLHYDILESWMKSEKLTDSPDTCTVGIIMAGNIPLVGFHDLLSVLISGHRAQIKLSERDTILMSFVIEALVKIDPSWEKYIEVREILKGFDAVIATGSDTTAHYFEKYFSGYPHIIRKNRNGVGVLFKGDLDGNLEGIGDDIFSYFGLGCRNISKLYFESGSKVESLFEHLEEYRDVINHNKYKNNFDYNYALSLLNKDTFYTNDFLLLRHDRNIDSRIASMHYEFFDDKSELIDTLQKNSEKIQCIISKEEIKGLNTSRYGEAQKPGIDDYADNVNTIQFLNTLHENS